MNLSWLKHLPVFMLARLYLKDIGEHPRFDDRINIQKHPRFIKVQSPLILQDRRNF